MGHYKSLIKPDLLPRGCTIKKTKWNRKILEPKEVESPYRLRSLEESQREDHRYYLKSKKSVLREPKENVFQLREKLIRSLTVPNRDQKQAWKCWS